jgi:hypothetical protein
MIPGSVSLIRFEKIMLKYIAAVSMLAVLTLGGAAARAADDGTAIGTIVTIEGNNATITPEGSKDKVPAKVGMHIHMHDVIQTDASSKVFLMFIDNTQMTLSTSTKLTVDEYVFDPDNKAGNKARYNIFEGTFDYLSGLVAKKKDPDVKVNTAYGSIGIRGTHFWGGHITGHAYGVHVADGAVGVNNSGGGADVGAGDGTFIGGPGEAPGKPGPWTQDQLDQIADSLIHDPHLPGLINGQKGKNKGLLNDYLKHHHHHGDQGENEPDLRMKDLPTDETGIPDLVPFTPGQGGCGNSC